jgi:hypothetical protein
VLSCILSLLKKKEVVSRNDDPLRAVGGWNWEWGGEGVVDSCLAFSAQVQIDKKNNLTWETSFCALNFQTLYSNPSCTLPAIFISLFYVILSALIILLLLLQVTTPCPAPT